MAQGDGTRTLVIEESREVLEWALQHRDPQDLLNVDLVGTNALIDRNDNEFKQWLRDWLEHPVFLKAMTKYQPWQEGDDIVVFPGGSLA